MSKTIFIYMILTAFMTISVSAYIRSSYINNERIHLLEDLDRIESNIKKGVKKINPQTGYVEFLDGTTLEINSQTLTTGTVKVNTKFTNVLLQDIKNVVLIDDSKSETYSTSELYYLTIEYKSKYTDFSEVYVMECDKY